MCSKKINLGFGNEFGLFFWWVIIESTADLYMKTQLDVRTLYFMFVFFFWHNRIACISVRKFAEYEENVSIYQTGISENFDFNYLMILNRFIVPVGYLKY